jgi:hypothetical protein
MVADYIYPKEHGPPAVLEWPSVPNPNPHYWPTHWTFTVTCCCVPIKVICRDDGGFSHTMGKLWFIEGKEGVLSFEGITMRAENDRCIYSDRYDSDAIGTRENFVALVELLRSCNFLIEFST